MRFASGPGQRPTSVIHAWLMHPAGVLLLVAGLATLIYSNTFSASFHLDDEFNIEKNSRIRQLTLGEAAGLRVTGSRDVGFWTFAANYAVGGLNVVGYHFVNLLIHITNGWLVYILVILFLQTPGLRAGPLFPERAHGVAMTTALLFVAHPIQTQAVTYIVQRFASLSALFYLVAVVCYLQWRLSPSAARSRFAWYAGALIATILAMKTKEISFTLPLMLVLVEGVGFRPRTWKQWGPLIPFLLTLPLIPLAYSGALGEAEVGWARETTAISRWSYLVTQSRVLVTYLRLLLLPIYQNLDYDYPLYTSLLAPPVLLSVLGLGSLVGLAVSLLRTSTRWRVVGLGVLWFFLTLAVESSLIPIRDVIVEHRLYLPSVGLLLAGSVVAVDVLAGWRGRLVLGIGVVALLALATYQRNRVWHDEVTLWSTVVAGSPHKARPHNNLGTAYEKQGRVVEAIEEYVTAIKLDPHLPKAHNNLGAAYAKEGRWEEAIKEYLAEINLRPNHPDAHYNLANAYVRQGRLEDAVKEYLIAVQLQPDLSATHNSLGNAYVKQGRVHEAMGEYNTAIRLDPDSPDAYHNLGNVYADQARFEEAVTQFLIALRLNPDFPEAHYSLGHAYHRQGRLDEAIKEFLIGIQLDPDRPTEHYHLGNIYAEQGRLDEAVSEYVAALKLNPALPEAHNNLGNAYARQGRLEEAIKEFFAGIQLDPNLPDAHYNLGSAYARQGRLEEALKEYTTVVHLKPDFPEAHYNIGNVYKLKGLRDAARKEFEIALKLRPDFSPAQQALESLGFRSKAFQ